MIQDLIRKAKDIGRLDERARCAQIAYDISREFADDTFAHSVALLIARKIVDAPVGKMMDGGEG